MKKIISIVVAVAILVFGGWYFSSRKNSNTSVMGNKNSKQYSSTSQTGASSQAPSKSEFTLATMTDAVLGKILVASNGMTLYKYANDTANVSNCNGACAVNWPPYVVSDASLIKVDPSISGSVSMTKRQDGTMQVTYNGAPLYYFARDTKAGDTTGQNVGGVWFVVKL